MGLIKRRKYILWIAIIDHSIKRIMKTCHVCWRTFDVKNKDLKFIKVKSLNFHPFILSGRIQMKKTL